MLLAFTREVDGFFHTSLNAPVKDWIRMRTEKSIRQENTCMATALVTESSQILGIKQNFDLPLLTKQKIWSQIIALEESYQEFFISPLDTPPEQKIFDDCTTLQSWFAEFLWSNGSYHLVEIRMEQLKSQNENGLGNEHPDMLQSITNLALTFRNQGRWEGVQGTGAGDELESAGN